MKTGVYRIEWSDGWVWVSVWVNKNRTVTQHKERTLLRFLGQSLWVPNSSNIKKNESNTTGIDQAFFKAGEREGGVGSGGPHSPRVGGTQKKKQRKNYKAFLKF